MICVLICDIIGLRSSLIAALLSHELDMRVIGSASTVHDTLKNMPDCDVLLIGKSLARADALEVASAAASSAPQVKTIADGYHALEPLLIELVQAGAAGYVLQDASVVDFLATIRELNHSKPSFSIPRPPTMSLRALHKRPDATSRPRARAA